MGRKKKSESNISVLADNPTLDDLENFINDSVGGTPIHRLSPPTESKILTGVSTGSMVLNKALSGNPLVGFTWGNIVELYGPPQCGKTTISLHTLSEAQKLNVPTLYIDAEHEVDPIYANCIGVDLTKLSFTQPDCGEEALEVLESAINAGYKCIIVDSAASLVPKSELEGNVGDAHVGLQARLMSQAMRRLNPRIHKLKVLVIFVNQTRYKVGVMFGNPIITPTGNALKFYSRYRLEVSAPRSGKTEEKDLVSGTIETGTEVHVTVVKNKVYPPYRKAFFQIRYGVGIDKCIDAVSYLSSVGAFSGGKILLNEKEFSERMLIKKLEDDFDLRKSVVQFIKDKENL